MKVEIYRTRSTRPEWVHETDEVTVGPGAAPGADPLTETKVPIKFDIAAAGGGATRVAVSIPPESFSRVVLAMLLLDEAGLDEALASARRLFAEECED